MVRFTVPAVLLLLLAGAGPPAQSGQDPAPGVQGQQEDQYFSGTITAMAEGKITVTRTVLGTESTTRTFLVTPETRFEGKAKVKARVTVQYVSGDDGDRAVHVLVRTTAPKK